MAEAQVRDVPKNPQPAESDNSAGNSGLQAGSSSFDYIESAKEMGKTAWNAAKDFVNNPEFQSTLGTIAQNPEVQNMLSGFFLGGDANAAGAGAAAGAAPVEKVKVDTEYAMASPSSYRPAFAAFSQLDPTPGDGRLSQSDLQQIGSDQRLENAAQSLANTWAQKENFAKIASLDGDASSISAADMTALFDEKNRGMLKPLMEAAKAEEAEADLRERVGLPRNASHEDYMKELERRGLSKYADQLMESIEASLEDETTASEEKMKETMQAAIAAGIPMETMAQVINSRANPEWGVKMEAHVIPKHTASGVKSDVPQGTINGELQIGHGGFGFSISPEGELWAAGGYRAE